MKQKQKAIASLALMGFIIVAIAGFAVADDNGLGHVNSGVNTNTNEDISAGHLSGINAYANVQTNSHVASVEDFNSKDNEDFNSTSIMNASSDIDHSVPANARETTFAQVSLGRGWVISSTTNSTNSTGYFANIFWVQKTFANTKNQTNAAMSKTVVLGALKIGPTTYNLNLTSETNSSMTFDVVNHKRNVTGTLNLNQQLSIVGFSVWSGTLSLSSGQTYQITLATENNKVSSTSGVEAKGNLKGIAHALVNGKGEKKGLWYMHRGFFSSD